MINIKKEKRDLLDFVASADSRVRVANLIKRDLDWLVENPKNHSNPLNNLTLLRWYIQNGVYGENRIPFSREDVSGCFLRKFYEQQVSEMFEQHLRKYHSIVEDELEDLCVPKTHVVIQLGSVGYLPKGMISALSILEAAGVEVKVEIQSESRDHGDKSLAFLIFSYVLP